MCYDLNETYVDLGEVKDFIDQIEVGKQFRKFDYVDKIIYLIYSTVMDFRKTDKIKRIAVSEKYIENVKGILNNKTHINHAHISGGNFRLLTQLPQSQSKRKQKPN